MSRTILALAIALFLGTAMLAHAQERMRTAAEIQAEIDKLQAELQAAKEREKNETQIKIFTLQHGHAHSLAPVVTALIDRSVPLRIAVDCRTNSIVVVGPPNDLKVIEAILLALDKPIACAPKHAAPLMPPPPPVIPVHGTLAFHRVAPLPAEMLGRVRIQRPEMEQRILQQLNTPITLNVIHGLPLEQALQMICAEVGIVPFIDRAALQEADVLTSAIVKIPVANGTRARSVLNAVLEQLGLAYVVDNELLRITTQRRARGALITKMYYVGDLVDNDPTPPEEAFIMGRGLERAVATQSPHSRGVVNGWSTGGIVGGVVENEMTEDMEMGFRSIFDIIQTVIEPESWVGTRYARADAGGVIGFHPSTKSLAIRQTECVHHQIEELITQIRKMHDTLQTAQEPHVVR